MVVVQIENGRLLGVEHHNRIQYVEGRLLNDSELFHTESHLLEIPRQKARGLAFFSLTKFVRYTKFLSTLSRKQLQSIVSNVDASLLCRLSSCKYFGVIECCKSIVSARHEGPSIEDIAQ